jgi:hypothetical protein
VSDAQDKQGARPQEVGQGGTASVLPGGLAGSGLLAILAIAALIVISRKA